MDINRRFSTTSLKLLSVRLTRKRYSCRAGRQTEGVRGWGVKGGGDGTLLLLLLPPSFCCLTFTSSFRYTLSLLGAVLAVFLLRPPALRSIPCRPHQMVAVQQRETPVAVSQPYTRSATRTMAAVRAHDPTTGERGRCERAWRVWGRNGNKTCCPKPRVSEASRKGDRNRFYNVLCVWGRLGLEKLLKKAGLL